MERYMAVEIISADPYSDEIGEFTGEAFEDYSDKKGIVCGYEDFCFAAREAGRLVGIIKGHAYYKEVHIGDLIVSEDQRGNGLGARLVRRVEEEFAGRGYENINLSTYAFQAPEFYRKLGYTVEHMRESSDERLTKYFLIKYLK